MSDDIDYGKFGEEIARRLPQHKHCPLKLTEDGARVANSVATNWAKAKQIALACVVTGLVGWLLAKVLGPF